MLKQNLFNQILSNDKNNCKDLEPRKESLISYVYIAWSNMVTDDLKSDQVSYSLFLVICFE